MRKPIRPYWNPEDLDDRDPDDPDVCGCTTDAECPTHFARTMSDVRRARERENPTDYVAIARSIHAGADTMVPDSRMLLEICHALMEVVETRRVAIKVVDWDGPTKMPIPGMLLARTVIGAFFEEIQHADRVLASLTRGRGDR